MEKKQPLFKCEANHIEFIGISPTYSLNTITETLTKQGFTILEDKGTLPVFKGIIDDFGSCILSFFGRNDEVGTVLVKTERRLNEGEMMAILNRVKEELPGEPGYNDHGYRNPAKPNEIDYYWDLVEGYIEIQWDGYNYTRGENPDYAQSDGLDRICIWIRKPLIKDEEYWRSEVD